MNNPFGKKDVVTENTEETVVETQEQEETEMEKVGFFAKHKKGLLIGVGVAALAAIGGLVAANKRDNDFDDYEDYDGSDDVVSNASDDAGSADSDTAE